MRLEFSGFGNPVRSGDPAAVTRALRAAAELALVPAQLALAVARTPLLAPRFLANLERMLEVAEQLNANAEAMVGRAAVIESRMATMEAHADQMSTQLGTFVRLTSPIEGAQGAASRVLRETVRLGGRVKPRS